MSRLMSFLRRGMAAVIVVGCACAWLGASPAVARPPRDADDDIRGLWVLRTSLTTPEKIDELVRIAVDGGYNTLLVQVRGRGDAYYRSDLDPRAADLAGQPASFDPLRRVLERAHARGLKVHAWFNVNLVSSAAGLPRSRLHVVSRRPDWLMVPRPLASATGRLSAHASGYAEQLARWTRGQSGTVEGLYLSPIPEGSQQYTLSVIRQLLARYPLDGLHLDYIRYPTEDFDYSAAALDAFRSDRLPAATPAERDRLDARLAADPLAWTHAFPQRWDAFRRDRLTTLVERIRLLVKATRPDAVLSAAVVPSPDEARTHKLQDWSVWAERGFIDVVCPMAYATTVGEFTRQIKETGAGAHGRPVWAGIGAWRLPVARTADHIRAARQGEATGVLLFSYDSLLTAVTPRGAYFSRLRPALVTIDEEP